MFLYSDQTPTEYKNNLISVLEDTNQTLTWVTDNKQYCVRTVFDQLGNDVFEDVQVPLHQVQTALSLLLSHSGRDNADFRVCGDGIVYKVTYKTNVKTVRNSLIKLIMKTTEKK